MAISGCTPFKEPLLSRKDREMIAAFKNTVYIISSNTTADERGKT